MTSEELQDFLENKMRMSHVYQPLLIRALLDAGGMASVRQLAVDFASEDEAQILYYEERIKAMPVPVLRRHGIVDYSKNMVSLELENVSFEQRVELRALCERKIAKFLSTRGIGSWSQMAINAAPIGESLRFEILRRDRICQLCGATNEDDRLEVDHIVPRSEGGTNEETNLQVLCARCNRGKSNRDDTDFRTG
jgi:hypothetical protein